MQIVEYSGGGSCSTYGGGDLENTDRPEEFMESLNGEPKITSGPECMGGEWMSSVGDADPEFIEEVLLSWSHGTLLQKYETGIQKIATLLAIHSSTKKFKFINFQYL